MKIAERLRRARHAAGLTQQELADRSGLQQSVIAAYESGSREPSGASCERILTAIGITPSILLDRHRSEVRSYLSEQGVADVRVFGSVARGDDDEGSDIDLLLDLPPDTDLFALAEIDEALERIIGTDVDVVPLRGLDAGRYRVHRLILDEAIAL